ncbi:hypothetical protein BJF84_02115 [Rhodococcus sp. CUA-806]|nr:hypothetical protein BJF84_02115 [Rhodococcus sp. CUA-806]
MPFVIGSELRSKQSTSAPCIIRFPSAPVRPRAKRVACEAQIDAGPVTVRVSRRRRGSVAWWAGALGDGSTTVDISNREHADCDQRQFMADPVGGSGRHGAKSSRVARPDPITLPTNRSRYRVKNQASTTSTSSAISARVTLDLGISDLP